MERQRERERERERERDSFGLLYTGYLLSIVNIKREIEREIKRERERERKREREKDIEERTRTKVVYNKVSQGYNKVRRP